MARTSLPVPPPNPEHSHERLKVVANVNVPLENNYPRKRLPATAIWMRVLRSRPASARRTGGKNAFNHPGTDARWVREDADKCVCVL